MTYIILLLLALVLANTPWVSTRLFLIIPIRQQPKRAGWCLLELVVLYFVMGGISRYAESVTMGQVAPQKWEFYATTACLFIVFSFPGFVYRFLYQR
jgi:Na+(H+)/acetate symporter ActP